MIENIGELVVKPANESGGYGLADRQPGDGGRARRRRRGDRGRPAQLGGAADPVAVDGADAVRRSGRTRSSRATSTSGRSSSPAPPATSPPAGSHGWRCARARWSSTRRRAAAARTPGSSTAVRTSHSRAVATMSLGDALLSRVADRLTGARATSSAPRTRPRSSAPTPSSSSTSRGDVIARGSRCGGRRQRVAFDVRTSDDYVGRAARRSASWSPTGATRAASSAACALAAREPAHDA